ncbi:hypothetical protein M7I_3972 [Glarea lozoyensis 74030]|uniref:37S ribosomal protein S35, mitochondrial n=1 Tax=Glarea lozoyensis (strain ATCC 74030 / MF5533) TaxID=1104152 RepID=H0EMX3_GLAL7|nr:hypothetical protein M7I_3972 [Glarea lozoyensis 74030]
MDKGNRDIPKDPSEALPPESARDRTPFPISRSFINQSVLSEEFRDEIWFRIMKQGKSVREVSVDMGVEMSRVGAVVRLKEVELEWKRIGKPLATPYAKAVMSMLPKTGFAEDAASERSLPERKLFSKPKRLMSDEERKKLRAANREQRAIEARGIEGRNFARHESINDLPVHSKTGQQIFHPTSESRQFTRADAAKVFDERLLPADDRIPHPEMVVRQRELVEGLSDEERMEKAQLRAAKAESKRLAEVAKQVAKDSKTKRVETPRWEFRFTEANVEDAGKTGRGHKGVGWRYGVPLYDRNKGLVKIPQSVE